ncbi:MAG: hypothetical protein JW750_10335 [Anaerolineaceae bacterium]|nr:hypothetical protein [Anaerolineaceae bacterium]
MISGMLWFDQNQQLNVQQQLEQAVNDYKEWYGKRPNVVYIHPSLFEHCQRLGRKMKLQLNPSDLLQPGHLWLGMQQ